MPNTDAADDALEALLRESVAVVSALGKCRDALLAIADRFSACLEAGGTIYLCGNGGSAADAQHIAAEFVGRFLRDRRPYPVVSLACNSSILTAIGNDYDFSQVFARQVRAHVAASDCLVGISTSGKSPNVLEALRAARERGAVTIGFTGEHGHDLAALCDVCLHAPSSQTPRIQEAHFVAWHLICDIVEQRLINT